MPRPRKNNSSFLRIRYSDLEELTIFQLGMLIKLAGLAAESPRPGYCLSSDGLPMSLEIIATLLKTTYTLVSKNVELLQNVGFIVFSDQGIYFPNWHKWVDARTEYQRDLMRRRRQLPPHLRR